MNELGKPDGKRSRGCRYWWREPIHYDFGGLQPKEKGWTDDDWKKFMRGEPVRDDDGREIIQPKD